MPVTINGDGTITGLNNGSLSANVLTDSTVTTAKLANGAATQAKRTYAAGEIIQTISNTFNNEYTFANGDGSGQATNLNGGFSVIPSATYVNVTAKGTNSKYLVIFQGNVSTERGTGSSQSDGINGFGFVWDPAGGTSFTGISGSANNANSTNTKFFQGRANTAAGAGGDSYWKMILSGSTVYASSKAAGSSLRFAIEYFHYDNVAHPTMYINRAESSNQTAAGADNAAYSSGNASNVTVMEIAA